MGSGSWNNDFYTHRETVRKAENKPVFAHNHAINTGKAAKKVHAKLDPLGVKIRESRDSKEHPDSTAIGIVFDITASMDRVPGVLQAQLPKLMNLLLTKGYIKDPQILIGSVGDATCDLGSLQVGQFESSNALDEDLERLWLVGGGGGQGTESYQNAMYFFARHTSIDCHEKRNKKGYLFLIGDEMSYPSVNPNEIKTLCGESIESSIPTTTIIAELKQKYNVFFIIPMHTSNGQDPRIRNHWVSLLGADHVLMLENEANICDLIGVTVGLCEGTVNLDKAREDLRTHPEVFRSLSSSLSTLASAKGGASSSATVRL